MTPAQTTLRTLITASLLMLACGAEVQVDDDGAGAGASSGSGETDGGGGASPSFDAASECAALCNQPCVGSPTLCIEYCLEDVAPGCERESLDIYACEMDYCVGEQNCEPLRQELVQCRSRGKCYLELPECQNEYPSPNEPACECSSVCKDDLIGTVSCNVDFTDEGESGTHRFDCACYFDGEFKGECSGYAHMCTVAFSCCEGWLAAD